MSNDIYFFSDTEKTILDYRLDLINLIEKKGLRVNKASLKNIIYRIYSIYLSELIISSNLRANIFSLIFFYFKKKVVIINGLGRFRGIPFLRKMFIFLLSKTRKTNIIVQNYRDYRWLKMHNIQSFFICGSGGRTFKLSAKNSDWIIISRNSKIDLQQDSIKKFIDTKEFDGSKLIFYGIDSNNSLTSAIKGLSEFRGYVKPEEFFISSKNFFQPDGYSEGFPHTLADAISSGCNICISKKQYIQLGLYLFDIEYKEEEGFVYFSTLNNIKLINFISLKSVNKKYSEYIIGLYKD